MGTVDISILNVLNQMARQSWAFDRVIILFASSQLLKGGIFLTAFWWFWFRPQVENLNNRKIIVSSLIGGLCSLGLARILAYVLPFRLRPVNEPALNLVLPFGMEYGRLEGWSSFPSDHATLYFMLAASLLYLSKRTGGLALLYAALVICLPRMYLGLHYASDILGGAAIGLVVAFVFNRPAVRETIARPVLAWHDRRPQLFYAGAFLFSYLLATHFDDVRKAARLIFNVFLK